MRRAMLFQKSYCSPIGLSTKNETELPKCSKRLHFYTDLSPAEGVLQEEQKAKYYGVDSCLGAGFRIARARFSRFLPRQSRKSPGIWPLRCLN